MTSFLSLPVLCALLACSLISPLCAQDWLPKNAEVCYRTQYEDGFLPDAAYSLKAKVTKEAFDAIVKKIGATPHTESRKYTDDKNWLSWQPEYGDDFKPRKGKNHWDPEHDLSTTFVKQQGNTWWFLKYEGGFLYYRELNH